MSAGHNMSAWDAFANDYVTWVEPHTSRNVLQLLDQLHLGDSGSLMEVGCASGLAAALYAKRLGAGWSVDLVDGSAVMVRLARDRHGPALQVRQGFLTNLPCVNSDLDAI
ncbi:MAG: class I SAM-dependent methyltransferase, partial [Aquabacterium sp.]|nr:class I SAM-dependent methyltransferase [Aquabacterium sp.]